jgi:L-fuconolactonase
VDIVDAQIHLFMTMGDAEALSVMDALGIQAALIDEAWAFGGPDGSHDPPPGYRLPDGVWRPTAPGATAASMRRPDRFSWLLRIDADDPDIDNIMSQVRLDPQGRAVRLNAQSSAEVDAAAEGRRADFFAAAHKHGLPVFVMTVGNAHLYEPCIRQFSDLPIIIDHCGVAIDAERFDRLLALAAYPNVYVKWCHAPEFFRAQRYPFPEVTPFLVRTLEAFGRERVMWASDFTAVSMITAGGTRGCDYPWGEALYYVRDHPGLSDDDKAWVLGATARKVLGWPAPAATL